MFEYTLPRMDQTQFELLSGPYGASVSANGTLKWLAISNLIADSWSELLIIKAKGVCGEYTLIDVTKLTCPNFKLGAGPAQCSVHCGSTRTTLAAEQGERREQRSEGGAPVCN